MLLRRLAERLLIRKAQVVMLSEVASEDAGEREGGRYEAEAADACPAPHCVRFCHTHCPLTMYELAGASRQ